MDSLPTSTMPGMAVRLGRGVMETAVLAVLWLAADRLGAWGWPGAGLGLLLGGWTLVSLFVAAGLGAAPWWKRAGLEAAGGGLLLVMTMAVWPPRAAGWSEVGYGFALSALVLGVWRSWGRHVAEETGQPLAERLRLLVVTAAALGVMLPMFTDLILGGTDARWYAFSLHDFIAQWRQLGPPVFLGQGEYVWNGAVHPFRSAPVYMHVAGIWDWLTLQSLPVVSLQHLTATSAALASGWGMYAAGVKLVPQHRWGAAVIAAVYAMNPAALMTLYVADAYMTYMAFAAYVWVFYGNVRVLLDGRGWRSLAAGLSLAWMCHPPTAMQVTLISAGLQLGALALGSCRWTDWRNALWAGLWFVALSAYYFVGMSELPKSPAGEQAKGLLQVALLMAGWFGIARVMWVPQGWKWAWVLGPVVVGLWWLCPLWLGWLGIAVVILGLIRWGCRRWDLTGQAPVIMAAVILAGAWAMDWLLRQKYISSEGYPLSTPAWTTILKADYFKPLTPAILTPGDVQPGWALWIAGLAAGVLALRRGSRTEQLMVGGLLLLLPWVLHWPGAGSFMIEYMPYSLVTMCGLSMETRMMPLYSAMLALAGLLFLRAQSGAGDWRRWACGVVLVAMLAWTGWEARRFVQRGRQITSTAAAHAKVWRTENAPMDRFVYDLLPIPSYFSNGKMDPRLELRLLDDTGNLIYGPADVVAEMEAAGSETFPLILQLLPGQTAGQSEWLLLEPSIEVRPGEHRLLRFEFDAARRYAGYLMMMSENGYREYLLPQFGLPRSFGTGPENSRVVSLWNSGDKVERYQLQFLLQPGHDLAAGMRFATVTVSHFQPELARLRLESRYPWRVRTDLPWSGQLEMPQVFLPGYEVKVDGRRIPAGRISASPDRLLQIAMPPGEHLVEVRHVGTVKLRLAGVVSLAAWGLLLAAWVAGPESWLGRRWRHL